MHFRVNCYVSDFSLQTTLCSGKAEDTQVVLHYSLLEATLRPYTLDVAATTAVPHSSQELASTGLYHSFGAGWHAGPAAPD